MHESPTFLWRFLWDLTYLRAFFGNILSNIDFLGIETLSLIESYRKLTISVKRLILTTIFFKELNCIGSVWNVSSSVSDRIGSITCHNFSNTFQVTALNQNMHEMKRQKSYKGFHTFLFNIFKELSLIEVNGFNYFYKWTL